MSLQCLLQLFLCYFVSLWSGTGASKIFIFMVLIKNAFLLLVIVILYSFIFNLNFFSLRNIQIPLGFGGITYLSQMLMFFNNAIQPASNILLVFYVYFTQTITGVSAVMICQFILSCIQFHFLYHRNLMLFFIASWCQIVLFSVACWYHLEKSLSIFSRCYFLAFIHVMLFSKDVSSTTSSRFLMIIIKIIINLFVNNIY